MKPSQDDTIAAIATPLAEGGLGVIRVSGSQAIGIVSGIFRKNVLPAPRHPAGVGAAPTASPGLAVGAKAGIHESSDKRPMDPRVRGDDNISALSGAPSQTCHFGTIMGEDPIDQVVATIFRAPHSYTGEDVVEISAHGNPFTLRKILNLCLAKGARMAGPGEFTERAFLNGKMDLTQAEAVSDLIRAKTDKSQAAALSQMQGRLAQEVRAVRDALVPLVAHLEVSLDHSDEDHDFLSPKEIQDRCRDVQRPIEALLGSAQLSRVLREGLRVALVGRVNVGKSSLLNALLKEDRAIVTPLPGTTRDTLEETVNWDGIPVVLTDTAGLRLEAHDPVELLGMERTIRSLQAADLVIGLFDGSEPLTVEDQDVIRQAMVKPHIWAINKTDLPQQLAPENLQSFNGRAPLVCLSAKTGKGMDSLIGEITRLALNETAQAGEAQWLLNTRHQAALERARQALIQATEAAQADAFEECVALELQTALRALGEIIGETTTEELLDQIFSQFCVGK